MVYQRLAKLKEALPPQASLANPPQLGRVIGPGAQRTQPTTAPALPRYESIDTAPTPHSSGTSTTPSSKLEAENQAYLEHLQQRANILKTAKRATSSSRPQESRPTNTAGVFGRQTSNASGAATPLNVVQWDELF